MDSVFGIDYADKTEEQRNDFVSHQTDTAMFEAALGRVIDLCYSLPARSRKLALQDMVYHSSRKQPGAVYRASNEHIRYK